MFEKSKITLLNINADKTSFSQYRTGSPNTMKFQFRAMLCNSTRSKLPTNKSFD